MIKKKRRFYKLLLGLAIITYIFIRPEEGREDRPGQTIPVHDKYGVEVTEDYEYSRDGFFVLASYENYLYGKIEPNILYKTLTTNGIRIPIYEFDKEDKIISIYTLKNGSMLVGTSESRWLDRQNGKVYLSKDGGLSFKKVLDLEIGDAYHWSYASDDEGYVYISEYGYKGEDNNARRIYQSKDYGESFDNIYEPKREEGYHNHKIHVDRKDKNKIYQVVGDDNKRLLISEDRGKTWRTVWWGNYHPTSIIDMGDHLLMGLDGAPYSGIIRFDKKTEEVSEALKLSSPEGGSVYTMLYNRGTIYAGFMSYGDKDPWDGTIYISKDQGKTWQKDYSFDKLDKVGGVGIYKFVPKGDKIYINIQLPYKEDGRIKHYFGTVEIDSKF